MATQTFQHSSFNDGICRVEFDINDANWRMSQIRCINNSAFPAAATIYEGGIVRFNATAPAGQTTSWNTTGVQLGWNALDGGLIMGAYTISIRFPA